MEKLCSLCQILVPQKSVNCLKLLHGVSFQAEVAFLNILIGLSWPGMSLCACRGLCQQKTYICRDCQATVVNCMKAHNKFNALASEILSKLSNTVAPQLTSEQEVDHVHGSTETIPSALNAPFLTTPPTEQGELEVLSTADSPCIAGVPSLPSTTRIPPTI